jgi:uncharacterized protein
MLRAAHDLLMMAYVVIPALALLHARRRSRIDKSSLALRRFVAVAGLGATVGAAYCSTFGRLGGARPLTSEIFIAAYFATSLVLLFRVLDYLLSRSMKIFLKGTVLRRVRYAAVMVARAAILIVVIIPGVLVACATYRPKLESAGDPSGRFGWQFTPVKFRSAERRNLAAWWIPAQGTAKATVLLCPGFGDDKSTTLVLVRQLVPAGYNVLAIDFYGMGESPGHIGSFGAEEQRDVLAALNWVRQNHPETSRICGIGVSTGAAALIAAAASPTGSDIQALAVYDPYCDFDMLWQSMADEYLAPPLAWLTIRVGSPMASLQTGQKLAAFHPGELATHLWPRPLLVLSSEHDPVVPFFETQRFFNTATQPKARYQVDRDLKKLMEDDSAAEVVLRFFNKVRPEQVI